MLYQWYVARQARSLSRTPTSLALMSKRWAIRRFQTSTKDLWINQSMTEIDQWTIASTFPMMIPLCLSLVPFVIITARTILAHLLPTDSRTHLCPIDPSQDNLEVWFTEKHACRHCRPDSSNDIPIWPHSRTDSDLSFLLHRLLIENPFLIICGRSYFAGVSNRPLWGVCYFCWDYFSYGIYIFLFFVLHQTTPSVGHPIHSVGIHPVSGRSFVIFLSWFWSGLE